MIVRIAVRLIKGDDSHEAAADVYEGESDDEVNANSSKTAKKKKDGKKKK